MSLGFPSLLDGDQPMLSILEAAKLISEGAAGPNSKPIGHCTNVPSYQEQMKVQKVCLA